MSVKRKFAFRLSTLLSEAGLIITAAEKQMDFAKKRLPENFVSQTRAKLTELGRTATDDDRNTAANALYDNLLTIQKAVEIEWTGKEAANRAIRDSFRLGIFPPSRSLTKTPGRGLGSAPRASVPSAAASFGSFGGPPSLPGPGGGR
jgi:hypothetical protein